MGSPQKHAQKLDLVCHSHHHRFLFPKRIGYCGHGGAQRPSAAGPSFTQEHVDDLRGLLGNARKFFDLPGAFVIPISTSLLPVLSGPSRLMTKRSVDHISSISMRVTLLIAIPASVGMAVFADPICQLLLFNKPDAAAGTAPLLRYAQHCHRFQQYVVHYQRHPSIFWKGDDSPVVNMAIGGVVKIVLSYVLIGIPEINAMGSAISTVVSYLLIMVLNLIAMRRSFAGYGRFCEDVAAHSAVFRCDGRRLLWRLLRTLPFVSPKLAVIPAIVLAVAVYAVSIVLFKAVTYDDVAMLPRGETAGPPVTCQKKVLPRHMRSSR